MRFEIIINGSRKCLAGIEGFGVLSSILTRVKRDPKLIDTKDLKNSTPEEFLRENIEISVGGLDFNGDNDDGSGHFHYFRKELKAGDEILIRILPAGRFDKPKRNKAKKQHLRRNSSPRVKRRRAA